MHEEIEAASPAAFSIILRRQLSAAFAAQGRQRRQSERSGVQASSIALATVTPTSLPLPPFKLAIYFTRHLGQLIEQLIRINRPWATF